MWGSQRVRHELLIEQQQQLKSSIMNSEWAESLYFVLFLNGESEVAQSCPTLCNPMDCSLPGSSVHGIFQARVLEWVAISFSRGSSRPRDGTQGLRIAGRRFTIWATREAHYLFLLFATPHSMWDFSSLTRDGTPVPSALEGGVLSTEPLGKSQICSFFQLIFDLPLPGFIFGSCFCFPFMLLSRRQLHLAGCGSCFLSPIWSFNKYLLNSD